MSSIYHWGPNHKPQDVFPQRRIFNEKIYHMSLINPTYIKNTSMRRAVSDVKQLRSEGWAARVVKFNTPIGIVYLVYERRTGKETTRK
jgi:hypothetical protein